MNHIQIMFVWAITAVPSHILGGGGNIHAFTLESLKAEIFGMYKTCMTKGLIKYVAPQRQKARLQTVLRVQSCLPSVIIKQTR